MNNHSKSNLLSSILGVRAQDKKPDNIGMSEGERSEEVKKVHRKKKRIPTKPARAKSGYNEYTTLNAAALQDHFSRALKLDVHLRGARVQTKRRTRQQEEGEEEISADTGAWTCEKCTLFNRSGPTRCEACGSLRSAQLQQIERLTSDQRTLAQKMGLVAGPPAKLSEDEWSRLEKESEKRKDSFDPCAICRQHFGEDEQLMLSCSHVFHKNCLESFERFVRSKERCCPLCRKVDYEKRIVKLGAVAHRERSALRIQTLFRGYKDRCFYFKLLNKHYADGGGDSKLRHRFFAKKINSVTDKIVKSINVREDSLDALFKEFDLSIKDSRKVLGHDPSGLSKEQWDQLLTKLIEREGESCECSICMCDIMLQKNPESLNGTERSAVVLSCSHVFHTSCIDAFESFNIDKVDRCPMCRDRYVGKLEI